MSCLFPSWSLSLLGISEESWVQEDFLCYSRDGGFVLLLFPHKQSIFSWTLGSAGFVVPPLVPNCCRFIREKGSLGSLSPAAADRPLKGALSGFLSPVLFWVWNTQWMFIEQRLCLGLLVIPDGHTSSYLPFKKSSKFWLLSSYLLGGWPRLSTLFYQRLNSLSSFSLKGLSLFRIQVSWLHYNFSSLMGSSIVKIL